MWAIIGGSGFEHFEGLQILEQLPLLTPFGSASAGLKRVEIFGQEVLFLPRHGSSHELLPHEVNYRANIFALKRAGASKILAISAVGSLQPELMPGELVIPSQYIDRTKARAHTFCGQGVVGHPSLAQPVAMVLVNHLKTLVPHLDFKVHFDKTYVCIEGPAFSTKAESRNFRQMGADIIGMTNFPEYALAREAGLAYLPCCFVTDYDSWNDTIHHVTLEEVLIIMKKNNQKALTLAQQLLQQYPHVLPEGCSDEGLRGALMTPWERIPEEKKEWLQVLMQPTPAIAVQQ
jgi:5'-methylthioadenosine phosphorylase